MDRSRKWFHRIAFSYLMLYKSKQFESAAISFPGVKFRLNSHNSGPSNANIYIELWRARFHKWLIYLIIKVLKGLLE